MTTGRTDLLLVYVPKQLHDGTARQGEYQGGQGNDGWLDLEKDIISSYQQKIVATIKFLRKVPSDVEVNPQ
jgi:hypothetical protein